MDDTIGSDTRNEQIQVTSIVGVEFYYTLLATYNLGGC